MVIFPDVDFFIISKESSKFFIRLEINLIFEKVFINHDSVFCVFNIKNNKINPLPDMIPI